MKGLIGLMKSKMFLTIAMAVLMAVTMAACDNEPAPNVDKNQSAQVEYSDESSMTDWIYVPKNADELTEMLITIDRNVYGSAGASLQQANAAVSLMKFAMDESGNAEEAFTNYLDGMNETQKDFFSFQWQQVLKTADALLDGSEDPAILEDAGNADFDIEAVDTAKVTAINETVTGLLHEAGVTDEWSNHPDIEPFCYALD